MTAWMIALSVAMGPVLERPDQASFVLEIALRGYRADGRSTSSAGDSGADVFESLVWTDRRGCGKGAGNDFRAGSAYAGWRIRGRVVRRVGDEFHVEIDWQRQWDRGRALEDGPKGSMQITMRPEERLTLDEFVPEEPGLCGVTVTRLEAAIVAPLSRWRGSLAPIGSGGAGGAGSGIVAGGGRGTARGASGAGGVTSHLAELWLVHTLPNGHEQVQRQALAFGPGQRGFEFPAVPVRVGSQSFDVRVGGHLRLRLVNGRAMDVEVYLLRVLRGGAGGSTASWAGGAGKEIPMPAPSDVISFELPAIPDLPSELAAHRFSVRVRLAPR